LKQFEIPAVMGRAVVLPFQAGSAAHNSRWAPRRYKYLFHYTPNVSLRLPNVQIDQNHEKALSPSIVAHSISQAKLWFPPSKLERNYNKLRLEARSGDSQSLRALGSRLADVLEFVTLGALLLAG
jgi:hypothetical protein